MVSFNLIAKMLNEKEDATGSIVISMSDYLIGSLKKTIKNIFAF